MTPLLAALLFLTQVQGAGTLSSRVEELTAEVRSRPNDFNARFLLGAALSQLGRIDDALRAWKAALDLRPDNVKLMMIMAVEYGKGRYFREAAAVADRALSIDDRDPNLYLIAIKSHQDSGDHDAALRIAARMVQKYPADARANFEYGFELHRAGRPAEGLPYLQGAMNADGAYEEPFFFYGEILVKDKRFEEALVPLRRAIALRRDYMAAWVMLARALIGLKRYDAAKAELLRAVEVDPAHPQPHLLLSQLYFRLGDEQAAAKEKELSRELRRQNPSAMETLPGRPFPK